MKDLFQVNKVETTESTQKIHSYDVRLRTVLGSGKALAFITLRTRLKHPNKQRAAELKEAGVTHRVVGRTKLDIPAKIYSDYQKDAKALYDFIEESLRLATEKVLESAE